MSQPPRPGVPATWIAFLVSAFVVVGLTGLFGTYAAPLNLQRAMAREEALDDALQAAGRNDIAALEALRPRLAESAAAILPPGGDMAARIAAARAAMRAQLTAEAEEAATRSRWLIVVMTLMGAAFGAAVLLLSSRRR